MLRTVASIAVYGTFLIVFGFLAIVLWQELFVPKQLETEGRQSQAAHSEQRGAAPATPSVHSRAEQAIADYTKVAVFTSLLVLATIALFVSGERNVDVAREAAEIGRKSAAAAKQSADIAIMAQRAFVAPEPYFSGSPDGSWNFGVRWQNTGNLPPRRLRNYIDFAFVEDELPPEFEFPDNAQPVANGTLLVPKQAVFGPHIPADGAITAAQVAQMRSGQRNLFIFGWAKYFDGISDTPERVTKFCYRVRPTGNPQNPFVFPSHSRHNCADEGCDE